MSSSASASSTVFALRSHEKRATHCVISMTNCVRRRPFSPSASRHCSTKAERLVATRTTSPYKDTTSGSAVLTTGFSDDAFQGDGAQSFELIRKPYRRAELDQKMRAVLDLPGART